MKAIVCRRLAVSLCLAAGLFAAASSAADLRPSWECLPEDTAFMVRLPRPMQFLETLRTRTKFGAVALNADRMRQAWELAVKSFRLSEDEGAFIAELEKNLAKDGLGPKDLEAAFTGDMGMGLVIHGRGDDLPPVSMTLVWLEPGTETAERLVAACHRKIEDAADWENPPQRVDLEMAGHAVTWTILRADPRAVRLEMKLDAEGLAELREKPAERAKQEAKATGRMHVFLARVGGRLLVGQSSAKAGGADDAAAAADLESQADEARGIFERFLAAHATDDESTVADILNEDGVRAALPAGEPLVDVVIDPQLVLEIAPAEAVAGLVSSGLADLGPAAWRIAFDAGVLRQGAFITAPAPRAGLFRILDQECAAAEVPSFVTSEAVDFTQISLDLAQAYRTIKEFALAEWGEQAANMFTTAEAQAEAWLGIGLEAMLANLGSRHWMLSYPSQVAAAVQEARRNRAGAGGAGASDPTRDAFVWKLVDDAPVVALLPKIAALAQAQVVEEQGFQGLRLQGGVSVFAGQGYLVVAMGGDALEKTLSGIRNPPAGNASLRESDVPAKGAELVGLAPCRMFSVGDARQTGGMLGELRDVVTAMVPEDVEDRYREILAMAQALLPSAEDMQGMFGVGAMVMEVHDAGIAIRSAWEMPAP